MMIKADMECQSQASVSVPNPIVPEVPERTSDTSGGIPDLKIPESTPAMLSSTPLGIRSPTDYDIKSFTRILSGQSSPADIEDVQPIESYDTKLCLYMGIL